ncbi:MAG: T9SS type A sorting domain-containing protein [Bacteroidales bacterium]
MKINRINIKSTGLLIVNLLICYNLAISQDAYIGDKAIVKLAKAGTISFSNGTNFNINSAKCVFDGTVEFAGSGEQNINGSQNARFADLRLNNSSVLTLLRDVEVRNKLILLNGVLYVLDNNLLIKGNASIEGNYSSASMIAVNGNGRLLKEVPGIGSYFLPVGDLTDFPDYSPVKLDFKSGKFSRGMVSVNLKNAKHPNNTNTNNYLKRFWSIRQTGISAFSCDVNLTYTNSDVVGSEINIAGAYWNISKWTYLNQVSGKQITGNVKLLSDFTGIQRMSTLASSINTDGINVIVNKTGITIQPDEYIVLKKIDIYNKAGQLVYSSKLDAFENPELSFHLNSDIYLLKIETNQETVTKKVYLP